MKVRVLDIHDSHGAVFTLAFSTERGREDDEEVLSKLNRLLKHVAGKNREKVVLYTYEPVELTPSNIVFRLTEGQKKLAKIDHLWNPYREDQKFAVVALETDERNNYPNDFRAVPHYSCRICGKDTYGVNRDTMEVFDSKSRQVKVVSVHDKCKIARLRAISESFVSAGS